MSEHQTACMADETSGRSRRPLFNSASRPVRALRLTVPARLRRGIGSVCVPFDGGPVLDQTIYALPDPMPRVALAGPLALAGDVLARLEQQRHRSIARPSDNMPAAVLFTLDCRRFR